MYRRVFFWAPLGGLWLSLLTPAVARQRPPSVKRGDPAWKRAHPSRVVVGPRPRVGRARAPIVNLLNLHTGEILPVVGYRVPTAGLVNRFLRCRWTGRQIRMAPRLMVWILEAARHFKAREIQVVSGFRHLKFNEMLRKKGRQVARQSNHRLGRAVDFRLVGVGVDALHTYLKARRLGGIGRYPQSKFIHLDTGRFRMWGGT